MYLVTHGCATKDKQYLCQLGNGKYRKAFIQPTSPSLLSLTTKVNNPDSSIPRSVYLGRHVRTISECSTSSTEGAQGNGLDAYPDIYVWNETKKPAFPVTNFHFRYDCIAGYISGTVIPLYPRGNPHRRHVSCLPPPIPNPRGFSFPFRRSGLAIHSDRKSLL